MFWPAAVDPLITAALAVLVALTVDRLWGEPPATWHPVVWMGRYLGRAGQRIAPLAGDPPVPAWRPWLRGSLAWGLGALTVVALAWLMVEALGVALAGAPSWWCGLVLGVLLKPLLAWRMLRDEVAAVEQALSQGLDAGRSRLAWLVSRDVHRLDEAEVRESAMESLAENLNDSVVAPLFWFALAGLPGAALYRFANTADAMWGYRGERGGRIWTWAGRCAARADDLLSWCPARLTAGLLWLASGPSGSLSWTRLLADAARTPSPNSGWPMAAMAHLTGVRLSKPGVYLLHGEGRSPAPADMANALRVAGRAIGLLALTATSVLLAGLWLERPW